MSFSDCSYMRRALELAKKARFNCPPNPAVGCVIVKDRRIIGEGFTQKTGEAHAEVMALRDAASRGESVAGATVYVTLEPCPMCAGAIVQARIPKVYIGSMNPKAGCAGSVLNLLDEKRFNHQVETEEGLLGEECSMMLKEFFKELREKRKKKKG